MARATTGQQAANIRRARQSIAKGIREEAERKLARSIQEFAVRTMNELAEVGPAWTGEFSRSWGFAPAGQTPNTFGLGGQQGSRGRYNKNSARLTDIKRALRSGVSQFSVVNTSEHAAIAIDEQPAKFIRPPFEPIDQSAWEHGDAMPRPGMRYEIGKSVSKGDPSEWSSRTAEPDWFPTYVLGGGLQKGLEVSVTKAFNEEMS